MYVFFILYFILYFILNFQCYFNKLKSFIKIMLIIEMCEQESQHVICELMSAIDQLRLNQIEMSRRAKETNEILRAMQKVTEELKEENARLYHENKLLRGKEDGFQKEHHPMQEQHPLQDQHPMQGMLRLAPVDDDEDDDDDDVDDDVDDDDDEVFEKASCWGCQTNQPNQLAHMSRGGCLYCVASDDEDTEEEREMTALNTCMDEMDIID